MDNDELLVVIKDMFEKKIDEVKQHTETQFNEVKQHTELLIEKLQGDIKEIAEGHSILNRKIDNLQNEISVVKDYVIKADAKLNEHEVILKKAK